MASSNVWIKNGTVRNGFPNTGVTVTGAGAWLYKDSPNATFQAVVSGTGAVTATVTIEFSNDGINALATLGGTITLSGTTVVSDGFSTASSWKYWRANVTAITGTGATVQVFHGV